MKLATIINSQEALKNLTQLKLPVKVSYKISKLINLMIPELKVFDEAKLQLVKKLGLPAENTSIVNGEPQEWQVLPKNMEEFQKDLTTLIEQEVDLGFTADKPLEKISLESLGDVSIAPQDLINLEWLISE